jgi:hypothetical protein
VPHSAPYIVWLPTGGPNGTLAVSAQSTSDLFLNTQNGAAGAWTRIASTVPGGYSRGMVAVAEPRWPGGVLRSVPQPGIRPNNFTARALRLSG